jgi:hypothetical protein
MRALRTAAFVLAEGVRMYFGAVKNAPGSFGELHRQERPLGHELVCVVESGHG